MTKYVTIAGHKVPVVGIMGVAGAGLGIYLVLRARQAGAPVASAGTPYVPAQQFATSAGTGVDSATFSGYQADVQKMLSDLANQIQGAQQADAGALAGYQAQVAGALSGLQQQGQQALSGFQTQLQSALAAQTAGNQAALQGLEKQLPPPSAYSWGMIRPQSPGDITAMQQHPDWTSLQWGVPLREYPGGPALATAPWGSELQLFPTVVSGPTNLGSTNWYETIAGQFISSPDLAAFNVPAPAPAPSPTK